MADIGAQVADTKVFTFAVDRLLGNITWYDFGVILSIKNFHECENLYLCGGNCIQKRQWVCTERGDGVM